MRRYRRPFRNPTKIFSLIDPRDGVVRFVGASRVEIELRVEQLIKAARFKKQRSPLLEWILEVSEAKGDFRWEVHAQTRDEPRKLLRTWIDKIASEGKPLLNGPPPKSRPLEKIVWTDEIKAQLGVIPDNQIAKIFGVARGTISYHRKRMGIPVANDRSHAREVLLNRLAQNRAVRLKECASPRIEE